MFNNIVKEYAEKRTSSRGTYDWWGFVNEKADLPTSLGFVKLLCPDMMEVDGCFVI